MAEKKEKKYGFVKYWVCNKCELVVKEPGPCKQCKGVTFKIVIKAEVVK